MTAATDTPWHVHAACLGVDTGLFFIDRSNTQRYKAAVSICRQCPVRAECLNDALTAERGLGVRLRYGVWGGLTPRQRTRLRGDP